MQTENSAHIKQLDGLRGIAILFVLFLHFFNYGFLYPFFSFGWSGVDLFFVLSGFLITGILLDTKRNNGYYKTFLIRRALRILPLYYGVLLVFALVSHYSATTNWFKEYQIYFWTHTSNYLILKKGFLRPLGHFWSLAVEEQFYIFWPLIILIFKPKQIIIVSVLLIISGIVIRAAFSNPRLTYGLPLAHMDGLLFGAIGAVLIRQEKEILFKYIDKIFAISLLIFFLYVLMYYLHYEIIGNARFPKLPLTITLISFLYSTFLVMSLKHPLIAKPLSNRLLLFFGKYSYGMYIYNSIFIHYSNWAGADRLPDNQKLVVYFGVFILTIIVSYASYKFFESKFLRLKYKIGGKQRVSS